MSTRWSLLAGERGNHARNPPEETLVIAIYLAAVIPLVFGLCGYLNVQ